MNGYFKFPEPYTDGITSNLDIRVGWRDRIALLWGGTIRVRLVILVEHTPGRMHSSTEVDFPVVPAWLRRLLSAGVQRQETPTAGGKGG